MAAGVLCVFAGKGFVRYGCVGFLKTGGGGREGE